jgi:hypothetical protein
VPPKSFEGATTRVESSQDLVIETFAPAAQLVIGLQAQFEK